MDFNKENLCANLVNKKNKKIDILDDNSNLYLEKINSIKTDLEWGVRIDDKISISETNKSFDEQKNDYILATNDNLLVLGTHINTNENIVAHPDIVKQMENHQIDGLKFMYKCCFNDLNAKRKYRRQDHGCILAHCMGLGKTLQLIALLHTAITHRQLETQRVLVICPKSTVLNWKAEIEHWLKPIENGRKLKLFTLPDASTMKQKINVLEEWYDLDPNGDNAGCLFLGYEAFRSIVFWKSSNSARAEAELTMKKITNYLLKPGADIVVLDEGHRIKNLATATSQAVNKIWTKRRIILTGTPMQNNLQEYYSMVNFIKPKFLGSKADFTEKYANPIQDGQHKDSSDSEVRVMKEKSYILHKKMSKYVQRRDVTVLKEFLPAKYEYDIFIPMTDIQNDLYEYYLKENPLKDGKRLLPDYQIFRKIWTHPKVLETAHEAALADYQRKSQIAEKQLKQWDVSTGAVNDDNEFNYVCEPIHKMFSPLNDWWKTRVTQEQRDSMLSSNKLKILFEILKICERENEKCLIFSEYTKVLDVVEMVMNQITERVEFGKLFDGLESYGSNDSVWKRTLDFYRLDGSTSMSDRYDMTNRFNDPKETRLRAFLISSKAGGQGINLIGANRVILLDTSWNPSNDQQSIFRVYRFGQKKKCYIYRLLAMGTMEEKIYSRSVTKQATSCRVVDKQQVERHYSMAELIELYTLTKPNFSERLVPNIPGDKVLADLLLKYPETIFKYHEHDSLLEKEDDLSEEEKEIVWMRYEKEAKELEAKLALEEQKKLSDPAFNESDPFWDDVNGKNSLDLEIFSAESDSEIPSTPKLLAGNPRQIKQEVAAPITFPQQQTVSKPNQILQLTIVERSIPRNSSSCPENMSIHSQIATNSPIWRSGIQHKPSEIATTNSAEITPIPSSLLKTAPRHVQYQQSIKIVENPQRVAPSSIPLLTKVPMYTYSRATATVSPRLKIIPNPYQVAANLPLPRVSTIQLEPLRKTIVDAAGIAPISLSRLKTVPSHSQVLSNLSTACAGRFSHPHLGNLSTQNRVDTYLPMPGAGMIQMQPKTPILSNSNGSKLYPSSLPLLKSASSNGLVAQTSKHTTTNTRVITPTSISLSNVGPSVSQIASTQAEESELSLSSSNAYDSMVDRTVECLKDPSKSNETSTFSQSMYDEIVEIEDD